MNSPDNPYTMSGIDPRLEISRLLQDNQDLQAQIHDLTEQIYTLNRRVAHLSRREAL